MTTSLRDRTVKLLQDRPASLQLKMISADTGLPEGWLKRLAQNRIEDPGVSRTQTLYEYLTKTKLI